MGSVVDTYDALTNLSEQIKARAEADILEARYISGFETTRSLEPESVKIVRAVKEAVEVAFDDHEIAYLVADSLSIRDPLRRYHPISQRG
jgi:hypothetical protein